MALSKGEVVHRNPESDISQRIVNIGSNGQDIDEEFIGAPANLAEAAQRFIDMRNECASILPKNMLRDIAWDLMLELFLAAEQGHRPFIKQLESIAGEPIANAMRRIDHLEESGLLSRRQDDHDHRRVHVSLTRKGYLAMANMLRHLYDFSRPEEPQAAGGNDAPRSFSRSAVSRD